MTGTVYRGEIYYVHETETTGSEQYGGRPAIIVSNNVGNEHSPVVEVVYLTTQEKRQLPTHVDIFSAAKRSTALCEQISTVHKGRLGNFAGQISEQEMSNIDKALAVSLGIGITNKTGKFLKQWGDAMEGKIPMPQEAEKQPEVKPTYRTHRIKLLDEFADDVLEGRKPFEIRENDRGYQKGDHVIFEVITKGGTACTQHQLNGREYEITYVLNGWGIKNGYVVFGIREAEA